MNDSQLEAIVDRRVQRALRFDRRYLHAADAEQQSVAEDLIEVEVELAVLREARLTPASLQYAARIDELERSRREPVDEYYCGEVLL